MVEKETSGTTRSNSPTPKVTVAASGGCSFPNATPPAPPVSPTQCHGLSLLIAYSSSPNQQHPDKEPNQGR